MKKQLIVIFFALLVVSGLFGEYSMYESPNGHIYSPLYSESESFSTISVSTNLTIVNAEFDPVMNSCAVLNSATITITLNNTYNSSNLRIKIDGNAIADSNIVQSNDDVVVSVHGLELGQHKLTYFKCQILPVSFDFYVTDSNAYYNNSYAMIFLMNNGASEHNAIRPALFVEGFSIPGVMDGGSDYTYDLIEKWKPELLDSKIYMLVLKNPIIDMRDNSMVVLGAIRFIHSINSNAHLLEGTSVFGYSMGGVLARYALAYAEQWNIKHYTTQYISIDGPHRGASLNEEMQWMIQTLQNHLSEYGQSDDRIDGCIEALESAAGKQLIRNNRKATGWNLPYNRGTIDYRKFYSEINEEDRDIYEQYGNLDYQISVLNEIADPGFEGMIKPGFPYKQNNIKCFAYSNGSTTCSGNNGVSPFTNVASYDLDIVISHWGFSATSCEYDTQPGSVLPDISIHEGGVGYSLELIQSYGPVLVPTRSSLYLKPNSTTGGDPIPGFDIGVFTDLTSSVADFASHTYFDNFVYAEVPTDVWNWRHGELDASWVDTNITVANTWLDSIQNRTVCTIHGHVSDNDISQVTGKMYVNGVECNNIVLDANGNYSIPYLYTNSGPNVKLVFEKPGCLPTLKRVSFDYSYAMLHDYSVENTIMYELDLNNIIVSQNGNGQFTSIQSAIDCLDYFVHSDVYDGSPIRIKLLPDTYSETIDLSSLADAGIPSLTIMGWGDGVIINRQVVDTWHAGIIMSGYQVGNLIIDNLTINHASLGVLVNLQNCNRVTISNCVFNLCSIGTATNWAITSNVPTTINQCTINDLHNGCISLVNNTDRPSIVTGCTLAHHMNAISITGTGHFDIINNTIAENGAFIPDPTKAIIIVDQVDSANLANNVISMPEEELAANCIYVTGSGLNAKQITINNNTFNYMIKCVNIMSNSNVNLDNNIFSNSQIGIKDNLMANTVASSYNLFKNVDIPIIEDEGNPAYHPGCLYVNEDVFDAEFNPIWNSTYMSPCIDTGIGENDPVDGTPPDIGARRAVSHDYWDYTFVTQADTEKWYWVSYPVLNSRTNNQLKASIFFEELLSTHSSVVNGIPEDTPTFLEEIDWMEDGDNEPARLYWDNGFWTPNQSSHYVSSPQGYKIKLLPRTPGLVTLKESGFRTPSDTPFTIYGGVENWLGYFRETAAWPHEAFASIWDDINMIKTKDWCMIRARSDGDYWGMSGKVRPLEIGDMVIVTTDNDHNNFQWNNANATPPESKSAPEHFVFNEKPDYVPVYVSIPDSIKIDLKEIGLYLDGVCKGAVVVEDSLEQICAYLGIDEKLEDGVVEFVFYYNPDKSAPQESKKIHLDSNRLSAQYIKGNRRYPYYNISLSAKDMDNAIPIEFALKQNYPNPFNPTTTIRYQLKESGKVHLEIYNLRGQLVKSLVAESQEAGYHSIIWNGKDNKNRGVASGVYLYRLKSNNNVQTKRMLLMK